MANLKFENINKYYPNGVHAVKDFNLEIKDKEFIIHYDFGYEYEEESAIFMFEDGNYSCDCNRSLFIQREYGDDNSGERIDTC